MSPDDLVRMRHILDAAREIEEFARGKSRSDLDTDRKLSLAFVRLLEIVGEAARAVSQGFRELHPAIPWSQMVGMRDRLIHGYYDVNLDIVWKTATEDIPALVRAIERLEPPLPPNRN